MSPRERPVPLDDSPEALMTNARLAAVLNEIADLLESLPYTERNLLWDLVDPEKEGEVLLEVGDEVRTTLIRNMPLDDLVNAAEGMDVDDLADFIQSLPEGVGHSVTIGSGQPVRT